jgi:hypothetical protein
VQDRPNGEEGGGSGCADSPRDYGSTLGEPGARLDDIIWLDPVDIGLGKLVARIAKFESAACDRGKG